MLIVLAFNTEWPALLTLAMAPVLIPRFRRPIGGARRLARLIQKTSRLS